MFRRSLLVFVAFLFLVLLMTVGYALTGLSGPESTLQDAEEAFAGGRFDAVIENLDWIERGSGSADAEVLERALRLRYRAHLRRGNTRQALTDLELLLERFAPDDLALALDRISVTIRDGDPAGALRDAEVLLGKTPDHPYLLELAGLASQAQHRAKMDELLADLQRKLSRETFREAERALLVYLFGAVDSPTAARSKDAFDQILKKYREQDFVVRRYDSDLDAIRNDIGRTRSYFLRALETNAPVRASFVGLAEMLENAGQHDALIALGETYLRRFPDQQATPAATYVAKLHHAAGRHRACLEVTERFLPEGTWKQGLEKRRFGRDIRELLLLRARSLRALGDTSGLQKLIAQLAAMIKEAGIALDPQRLLANALYAEAVNNPAEVDRLLGLYCRMGEIRTAPTDDDDRYAEAARMRLAAMRKNRAGIDEIDALFADWIAVRPTRHEPLLERARLRLEGGHGSRALDDAARAYELAGQDEEALRVYTDAADLAHAASNRDSRSLLQQCLRSQSSLPRSVALDVLYLALARRAIQEGHPEIALAASRRAAQVYTWSRQPRMLWAIAALRLDLPEQALQALQLLRERDPDDRDALTMLQRARARAEHGNADLLFEIAQLAEPDPQVARAILQSALARWDAKTGLQTATRALQQFPNEETVVLAAGRVLAAFGNGKRAREVLAPLLDHRDAALRVPAVITCLLSEARDGAGSELDIDEFQRRLTQADTADLFEVAVSLHRLGRPRLALDVLEPVLSSPEHAAARDGQHHLLAGTLCLELGELAAAERHFTAALTFESGEAASRPLTLLLLRAGRDVEATDTYWDDRVEDQVSACLAIRFGKPAKAHDWIKEALSTNPSDVAAIFLRHMPGVGLEQLTPIEDAATVVEREPALLLDVLIYTAARGFSSDGLEKANALREKFPDNPFVRILRCRALSERGQPQQALDDLVELAHDYSHFTPAYDEIVRLLEQYTPREPLDAKVRQGIFDSAYVRSAWSSPRLKVQAARDLASRFMLEAKHQSGALTILSHAWSQYPVESRVGAGELDLLLREGQHAQVGLILDALEAAWPASRRANYLRMFGRYATKLMLAGADKDLLETLERRARQLLENDGAHGALVHFLLLRDEIANGPLSAGTRRRDERQRAWVDRLLAHVRLFEEGIDTDLSDLLLTLRRLELLEGSQNALSRIDALLHRDLSLLPVWRLRAEILERIGDTEQAMRTLNWLPLYFDAPELLPAAARLAAQVGDPSTVARAASLQALPPAIQRIPEVRLALGLCALREAKYPQAATLLEGAAERLDGARQFYRAAALLPQPGAAAATAARAALDELVARYPKSSFAPIAAHLSRQLSWSVNASPTPTNR